MIVALHWSGKEVENSKVNHYIIYYYEWGNSGDLTSILNFKSDL